MKFNPYKITLNIIAMKYYHYFTKVNKSKKIKSYLLLKNIK